MKNQIKFAWLAVIVLFLISASFLMQPTQASAAKMLQVTATFTATSAPTNTPTATATPIATQLPMVYGASGLYNGVRVGNYAVPTPSVNGSAFQSTVGSIDLYSSAGRHTIGLDNETGNVTIYGTINSTGAMTMSGALNMQNNVITNIGAAGTDFGSDGSLVTAKSITVTSGSVDSLQYIPTGSGSAAATNFCTSGDCDSGMYTVGDNIVGFSTGGTERARISSAGLSATALGINSVTFTGAIKYGVSSTYTSGAAITTGFTVTPTACILFPQRDVTETITLGATTISSNRASQSEPLYWMCGQ